MRKLLSLLTVILILLGGCSKEPTSSSYVNDQNDEGEAITVQIVDLRTMEPIAGPIDIPIKELNLKSHLGTSVKTNNVISASGHYEYYGDVNSFSANQTPGGVNGQFQITSPGFGNFHMQTTCLEVDGNEAAYCGVVTQVPSALSFLMGWHYVTLVKDNGEGANASPDQHSDYAVFFGWDLCGEDLFLVWEETWVHFYQIFGIEWSWVNVDSGGNIQVNN